MTHSGFKLLDTVEWPAGQFGVAIVANLNVDGTVDLEVDNTCVPSVDPGKLTLLERFHIVGLKSVARLRESDEDLGDLLTELPDLPKAWRQRLRRARTALRDALGEMAGPSYTHEADLPAPPQSPRPRTRRGHKP